MTTSRRRSPLERRRAAAGRVFVTPNVVAVGVFMVFPLGYSLYLSFHRWNLFGTPTFIGAANFRRIFTGDPLFYTAVSRTAVFTVATIVPAIAISLVVAAVLNRKLKGIGIFRSILFLPLVTSAVAMAVVWRFIFNTDGGLLNGMLGVLGIGPVDWLNDPGWAMVALCVVSVWKGVPFSTIILLAAMQGVSDDLYEAAELDGAGEVRRFVFITIPMIRSALSFVFVISIINSVQVFDQAYVLTGGTGGPETGTYVFGIMLFENAFAFDDIGYACALAWVLFAILLVVTVIQFRLTRDESRRD